MDPDFYKEFENCFRGSREEITKVLSNYDCFLEYILKIDNHPSLLDIGSGRGEWMQKCNKKGFKSIGLELNSEMAYDCKKLNLDIIEGDALSLLDQFPEENFSIVSAFHVVEHMNHENLQKLILKSKRILKPEGLLILETPSIDNLLVATKSFHLDPTHINPIHSDLLAFMIKKSGFKNVKCYFINGGPLQYSDHGKLTRVLNGVAQDIVLISSKSEILDNKIFENSNLLKEGMSLGIKTLDAAVDFDNYLMTQHAQYENRHAQYEDRHAQYEDRHAQYDEAIFLMRKRIIDLERKLEDSKKFQGKTYKDSIHTIPIQSKRIINSIISKLNKKFVRFFRYILHTNTFISFINKLYKIQLIFFVLRDIEKKLDNFGYRIYHGRLLRKSSKLKEDKEMVIKHDADLIKYFDKSRKANTILNHLNKHNKL